MPQIPAVPNKVSKGHIGGTIKIQARSMGSSKHTAALNMHNTNQAQQVRPSQNGTAKDTSQPKSQLQMRHHQFQIKSRAQLPAVELKKYMGKKLEEY